MIRNKSTIQIISRLLMAVFLFVIISPLSVYASGDSASDNDTDEEYQDWSDAFNDTEYTENLAENIARTWANYFVSYIGTTQDVVERTAEIIGDSYDRTVSLYDNLYTYILPYSRQTVNDIDGANLSIGTYGKPIRNKNNLKLINQYVKTMENSLPTEITNIASDKHKDGSDMTFAEFPPIYHFSDKPFNTSIIVDYNNVNIFDGTTHNMMWCVNGETSYDVIAPADSNYDYVIYDVGYLNGTNTNYAFLGVRTNNSSSYRYRWVNNWPNGYFDRGTQASFTEYIAGKSPSLYIYGSGYIEFTFAYRQIKTYYWDQSKKSLYYLGIGTTSDFLTDDLGDPVKTYEVNIINSVDFGDYTDLINQLILDVNMENNITNSLLIELLNELRNQRDVYQPISDDDDIYNYIDYMMNKLLEVKDVHIEIPDLSPNMGGIVDGITALLNFLASIIRTLGSIVSSLLEGLVHLFVPTDADWDEINIQFESLTAPFGWIKDFIAEAASNISLLLFGRNVTDFETAETEDVDLVMGEGSLDPDIVYDPTSGAPKIPVRFSNSTSEYFSGIEDAYIIDMSWYAPYKPVGDIIVVAFCWLMFIWRVLHDLPGIINGATGAFDQSPQDYSGYLQKEYASWKFFGRK